jgi:hypothetical protein
MRDILHMIEIQVWQGRNVGRIYPDWGKVGKNEEERIHADPPKPLETL